MLPSLPQLRVARVSYGQGRAVFPGAMGFRPLPFLACSWQIWGFSKLGREEMAALRGCPQSVLSIWKEVLVNRICKSWPGCIEETPVLGRVGS